MVDKTIGVVIPTRDRNHLLISCIDSVLRQTRPPDQIVVVDDFSRDPVKLPPEVTGRGVKVIRCSNNGGPSAARNLGLQNLETDLVAFIDDDDRWLPSKLENQSSLAHSPKALIACDVRVVSRAGRSRIFRVSRDIEALRRSLLYDPSLPPSAMLADRSHILSVGGFDPELRMMEDWDLWLRLSRDADFHVVPEVLVIKAAHRGAASQIRTYRRVLRARLHPYLSALDRTERKRVESHHDVMDALLALETGERWTAMRALVSSLALFPSRIALQGIVRVLVGERTWSHLRHVMRGTRNE